MDFAVLKQGFDRDLSSALGVGSLGLELKPVKVPTEAIVIDHIERPAGKLAAVETSRKR